MKGILVIDLPTSCTMCRFQGICKSWNEEIVKFKGYNERLDNCPLRPLPKKKYADFPNDYEYGYADGYNTCLLEIGETE